MSYAYIVHVYRAFHYEFPINLDLIDINCEQISFFARSVMSCFHPYFDKSDIHRMSSDIHRKLSLLSFSNTHIAPAIKLY